MPLDPLIAFLTDFGRADHFVGVMEGVLSGICPKARIIHLTHDVPPQDVLYGAFRLLCSVSFFPKKTLFVCVVDPGVGSQRRILYIEEGHNRFLTPDNGLVSWAVRSRPKRIISVENTSLFLNPVSRTFHGRDIFAPVAGYLAKGLSPEKLGPKVSQWRQIPFPEPEKILKGWKGRVLAIDHFGNLVTNIGFQHLAQNTHPLFLIGKYRIKGMAESYAQVRRGKPLAVLGSSGFIEISVSGGNAAKLLQSYPGQSIGLLF